MKQENILVELRAIDDKKMVVEGLLNDYNLSKTLEGTNGFFKEKISKEVWERALNDGMKKLFVNHEDFMDYAEDLKFEVREDGVYFNATLKEGAEGLYNKIKSGFCDGLSFGFKCLKDTWSKVNGTNVREVLDMAVSEISLLIGKTPAYNSTFAEVRSIEIPNNFDLEQELEEEFIFIHRKMAELI